MFAASAANERCEEVRGRRRSRRGVCAWPRLCHAARGRPGRPARFRKCVSVPSPAEVSIVLRHRSIPRTIEVARAWYFGSASPLPPPRGARAASSRRGSRQLEVTRWHRRVDRRRRRDEHRLSPRMRTPDPRPTATLSNAPSAKSPAHAPSYAQSGPDLDPRAVPQLMSSPHRASQASGRPARHLAWLKAHRPRA